MAETVAEDAATSAPPDAAVDAAWQEAMARLTRSEELCDVVFVVGGKRLPALRQLCALHSEPLAMLFHGDCWRDEPHGGDVDVGTAVQLDGGVVSPRVFGAVLDWVYGGCTDKIDASTAVETLVLADYLQVEPLKRRCGHWLSASLVPANVVGILESALAMHEEGLVAACLAVIEEHTTEVLEDKTFLTTVTEETLCRILVSPRLSVADEFLLYTTVVSWGQVVQQGPAAGQAATGRSLVEVVAKPMSHVRLGLIAPLQLSTIVMPAAVAPLQDVALALAFHAAGMAAVPEADVAQFTARTGTRSSGNPTFGADRCNAITVSDNGHTLTATRDPGHCGALSDTNLRTGVQHYAEFTLKIPGNVMLGVATTSANANSIMHQQNACVWLYAVGDGNLYGTGTKPWVGQQTSTEAGVRVGLLVDLGAAGSITVFKNDQQLGVMHAGGFGAHASSLRWCVCIHGQGPVVACAAPGKYYQSGQVR
jgi:hypothetical protein